jgi:YHS domain-containing protein
LGLVSLGLADRFFPDRLEPVAAPASPAPAGSASDLRFRDPVTNEVVDPMRAAYQVDLYGTTFYFATRDSLQKFREDPLRYVQPRVRIRVRLTPEGSPVPQGVGEFPQETAPSGPAGADSWMDPTGPPPPIEADASSAPGQGEPILPGQLQVPSRPVPSVEAQGESEPILPGEPGGGSEPVLPGGSQAPGGGPGWLPGNAPTGPARLPDAQVLPPGSAPTVSPGDQDVIIDERPPSGR